MKKKKYKIKDMYLDAYKETGRKSLLVYLVLRGLVLLCMFLQVIRGDIHNALLCWLSLVLLLLPSIIQNKLDITLPNTLEIIIYLFIFSSEILGEINNFYGIIPHWDTMLHTLNGFLCAAIGFSIVDFLNKSDIRVHLSPIYLCIVAFCFSMTIGVLWEFFEYGADKILLADMQKDTIVNTISTVTLDPEKNNNAVIVDNINKTILYDKDGNVLTEIKGGYLDIGINDTMKDLLVNFLGALVFCFFGYFYLKKGTQEASFIDNFIPKKGKRTMPKTIQKKLAENSKKQLIKGESYENQKSTN